MPIFLVTNDDGAASPALPLLIDGLSALGTVRVAVPAHEQSWKGKAMTRFGQVRVQRRPELGEQAFAVEGTPADCVNLGVHNLFDGPPDWVISGINIGANIGLSFLLNSGTVGAAMEGALLGLPAVAFSLRTTKAMFAQWSDTGRIGGRAEQRALGHAAGNAVRVMRAVLKHGLPAGAMVLNVNFPIAVSPSTPIRWTHLLENRYGPLFDKEPQGEGYRHRYQGDSWRDPAQGSDWDVVEGGEISVTPLTFSRLTHPPGKPFPLE
ncbi:MAG: 5'/3'-nucleotidase SurE [bacterium]